MSQGREVVLVGAARTPIGKFGGVLASLDAVTIGAAAMQAAVQRSGIDPGRIDEAIVGHARQANNGPNPGRLMTIGAGLPVGVATQTVQQACVSSMKALILASQAIRLGDADAVLVGGSEHMSSIPYYLPGMRWGTRMGDGPAVDGLSRDGFRDPLTGKHMGALADAWSERFGISREAQDQFALRSQERAAAASDFARRTIEPIEVGSGRKAAVIDSDEHPRKDTTLDSLGGLKPVFVEGGSVTAGNASGITDGAAGLVVTSAEFAAANGLTPSAYVRGYAVRALTPADYGIAVAPASAAAIGNVGISYDDIDVIEINEAFAIQVLAACAEMGIDAERVNPNGGAIALGHPVGASGARIVQYAAQQLNDTGGRWGLATICGNGGHGGAIVLENANR